MKTNSSRLIFIGGCPRSGTTLVKRIVNAHSQIYCGPEFGHLPNICNQYELMKKGIVSDRIKAYCSEEQLKDYFKEFILNFVNPTLAKNRAFYFAEKTPDNILVFFTLHELFPKAKFIHVIRNPLDVVASYLRVGARSNKDPQQFPHFYSARHAAAHWVKTVNSLWGRKDKFNEIPFQQRYLELRYEDIVENTKETVSSLCMWLGVEFEPALISIGSASSSAGDPSSFGDVFYTEDEYFRPIDSSRVSSYKKTLTHFQISEVMEVAGKLMLSKGYRDPEASDTGIV